MSIEKLENKNNIAKAGEMFEKEKPKIPEILYHGSRFSGLKKINPKAESIRDSEEGLVVFATSDKAFATMFLGPRADDSWSTKGSFGKTYYTLITDEERYHKEDKGGVIYSLPGKQFYQNLDIGMKTEYVSKEEIEPIKEEDYASALEAMILNEVQVFFVDGETLDKFKKAIKKSAKEGLEEALKILESLESENQKTGRNIRSFRSEEEMVGDKV